MAGTKEEANPTQTDPIRTSEICPAHQERIKFCLLDIVSGPNIRASVDDFYPIRNEARLCLSAISVNHDPRRYEEAISFLKRNKAHVPPTWLISLASLLEDKTPAATYS
jgi:hypothetical protein